MISSAFFFALLDLAVEGDKQTCLKVGSAGEEHQSNDLTPPSKVEMIITWRFSLKCLESSDNEKNHRWKPCLLGLLSYRLPKGIGFDLLVDILNAYAIIPDCRPGNE